MKIIISKIMKLTIVEFLINTGLGRIIMKVIQEMMNLWIQVGILEKGFIVILMVLPIPVVKEVYIITRTIMIKRKQKRA